MGEAMQVEHVAVTMSPQHFKAFYRSLAETLKAYESAFGALTIPDSDVQPSADAAQIEKLIEEARQKRAAAGSSTTSSSIEKKPPSKRSRGAVKH